MHKDSTHDYTTAVSTQNAASGIDTIKGQQNKSYCASDLAQQQHHDQTTLEQTFNCNDTACQRKTMEKLVLVKLFDKQWGMSQFFSIHS